MSTQAPAEGTTATFADLGVDQELADTLAEGGIVHPFPIQEITLPLALAGADVIGQARTGTGKTLAFGLPLLQRVAAGERTTVALVIVPTRELCLQVRDDLANAAQRKDVEVLAVYGGRALDPQIDALRAGAPVVVGTPGRLLDLLQRGALKLSGVKALVLDEADEMLDLGFLPDVERLIEATATQRQTMLFSATMPPAVVALARRYMSKPTFLRADVEESHIAPATRQHFFSCHRMDKPAVLARILQSPERGLCVVFTRTKRMADILANELRDRGIDAAPIHSDLRQEARERALKRFREGKTDVLVATEVAARGLDIDDVTHVVNYDTPDDEKMYLHRIGRTGRAGAAGVAITLALWNELARVEMIKRALDVDEPTHEVFSTSEILDDLFDLPPRESRQAPSAKDWQRAVDRGKQPPSSRRGRGESKDRVASGADGDAAADEVAGGGVAGETAGDEGAGGAAGGSRRGSRGGRGGRGRKDSGAPSSGRRGGRRGSGEEPTSGSDATASGAPAAEKRATDEEASDESTRTRVRRRSRAPRERAATDDAAGPERAGADGAEAPDHGTEDESGSRRVRRRVSRTGEAGEDQRASGGRGRREPGGRAKSGEGTGGRSGGSAERKAGAERNGGAERNPGGSSSGGRGRSGTQTKAGNGGKEGRGSSRSGSRSDTESGGSGGGSRGGSRSRSGSNRRSDDRRGGRSGSGRSASGRTPARQAPQVDSDEARGDGQPRLRRPLEVVHLP